MHSTDQFYILISIKPIMTIRFSDLSISKPIWKKIQLQLEQVARPLELARFNYFFESGSENGVLSALEVYQNFDGGFGHGIEPDFYLPESSPMATSVALRILSKLPKSGKRDAMVKKTIIYLKSSFCIDRIGWFAVPEQVNNFPHAPWWEYDKMIGKTVIDNSWGNPSAELIGYLWYYRDLLNNWDINPLIEHAIHYFQELHEFPSEHEIFCYLHLYHYLPIQNRERLYPNLKKAIATLIELDSSKWYAYVPIPYKFALFPEDIEQLISLDCLHQSLLFLKGILEQQYVIKPSWEWNTYPNHWIVAKKEWIGVLTIEALQLLSQFSPD
jgi:hypothetical protein